MRDGPRSGIARATPHPRRAERRRRLVGLAVVLALAGLGALALVLALGPGAGEDPAPGPAAPGPAAPPPSPPGRVLWGSDFEDGDLGVYRDDVLTDGSGDGGRHEITTERARTGRRAVKVTLPPSTAGGTVGRYQLVADAPDGAEGDERWYGISILLGEDWSLDQVVQNRELFLGTFGFRYTDTRARGPGTGNIGGRNVGGVPVFKTEINGFPAGDADLGPAVTGQWVDFVVHTRWSRGEDGFREIFRDGSRVTRYDGPTLNLDSRFEHRMGLYQGTQVDHPRTLYWDNHRVGTSYRAVDPSR